MDESTRPLAWQRTDGFGGEVATVRDSAGLRAHGWAIGSDRRPYHCSYSLTTDAEWRTTMLEVRTEGAGWERTLTLQRAADGWRVRTGERGNLNMPQPGIELPETLDPALDIDLGHSPLTNTLPIRRLGLLTEEPGTAHELTIAWVQVPALFVLADPQIYIANGPERVTYRSERYEVDIDVDKAGFVRKYPGLAIQAS